MNVYGEIREHIQSLQLVVCLPLDETQFDVKISDEEIEVDSRTQKVTFILPNIQLIPNSCHNLSWVKGEGAHMIFRVKDHTRCQEGENSTGSFEAALMDSDCQIVCATCRKSILNSQCKFDRVCQLPSDHWQEMVEDWQCHASQDVAQIARKTLVPSSNECFMNSTSLIVSPKVINEDVLRSSDGILTLRNKHKMDGSRDKYLTCRRCCSLIGKVSCKVENYTAHWRTFSSLEIFQYSVDIVPRTLRVIVQPKNTTRLEIFLSNYILNISKTYMAFRFIVQSEEDGSIHALITRGITIFNIMQIWLINSEMKLLTSQQKTHKKLAKFIGGTEANNEVDITNVGCAKIVKILYEQCLGGTCESLSQQWNKDMAVHSIILPKQVCLQVLLLLATNTSTMPRSLQTQNNFKVGFLRLK